MPVAGAVHSITRRFTVLTLRSSPGLRWKPSDYKPWNLGEASLTIVVGDRNLVPSSMFPLKSHWRDCPDLPLGSADSAQGE